jgi:hypothetical protein
VDRKSTCSALFLLAALGGGCGDVGPPPPGPGPASLRVENQSQFILQELRIHTGASYADAPNLLDQGMPIGASMLRHGSGSFFVTVFRERFLGGPVLALTTGTPIELFDGQGYQLLVFDESFRLNDAPYVPLPDGGIPNADAGIADGGVLDGGT